MILKDAKSSEALQERDTDEIGREKRGVPTFLAALAALRDHVIGGDRVLCAPSAAMEVPAQTGSLGTEIGVQAGVETTFPFELKGALGESDDFLSNGHSLKM